MKFEAFYVSLLSLVVCSVLFVVNGGIEPIVKISPPPPKPLLKKQEQIAISSPQSAKIPQEYISWKQKGEIAEKKGELTLAIRCYSWALSFYSDHILQQRISELTQKISRKDAQLLRVYDTWQRGLYYENNGKYSEAVVYYEKIKDHPLLAKKVRQRIEYCRERILRDEESKSKLDIAQKLQQQGEFAKALKMYASVNTLHAKTKIKTLRKIYKIHKRIRDKVRQLLKEKRYIYALRYISHPSLNKNYFKKLFPRLPAKVHDLLVFIPRGNFVFGNDEEKDETPRKIILLSAFYIRKYEVTNAEYYDYVKSANVNPPQHWQLGKPAQQNLQKPVTGVSWNDAVGYCNWMGVRLPTEKEWEKAARGDEGFVYPWGNKFYQKYANTIEEGLRDTAFVGQFSSGKSSYGCYDMIGNVLEWTADNYQSYEGNPHLLTIRPGYKVARGGSWYYKGNTLRCSKRYPQQPQVKMLALGFRYVIDANQIGTRHE
ncbi:SUMF1/EgtB/PvdO family nonheme iron enzyme [Candidatus Uabimicrobium amorphum]|uniref:Sulfatase-modifying factor enzyme-like domain-containing protein n=1 Tax=Uabimicrobium amorphum TaxID=2596890 RepID=A0A5S9IHB6_UABAM|nr:SUMF1/EgtB/PvdO family nonheme iron enzyme [Candidatus Uabimicrobium amorphum]BBM81773.1 hypothetical protein UABAM_00112 [Candidatus Uabimicrobium amorphum]